MKNGINTHPHGGFSLLEVLIAIVVLSIGLLGLVGLQTTALKVNGSAVSRTVATDYANGMMEKVRTDLKSARAGYYSVKSDGTLYGTAPASKETKLWLKNLKQAIPNARVQSCRTVDGSECTPDKGNYHMVCIKWDQGDAKLFEAGTQQVFLLGRL